MKLIELKNDQLKQENLRLKAENKQFYGEQSILIKELDEQYHTGGSLTQEELHRQLATLKQEIVRLMIANQALNKQHAHSLEKIKQMRAAHQEMGGSTHDQLAIKQSLESELEREKRVRIEAENDRQEYKQQLILIKEKGQQLVESLKTQNEQNEFEIKRIREENAELANQVNKIKQINSLFY